MNVSITRTTKHFSLAASLAAIGVKLSHLDLFGPIRTQVQIRQKTVKHTPADKFYDALFGWVTEPPTGYVRPVRRIAVRCRRQDGTFAERAC